MGAGGHTAVTFTLSDEDWSFYDSAASKWVSAMDIGEKAVSKTTPHSERRVARTHAGQIPPRSLSAGRAARHKFGICRNEILEITSARVVRSILTGRPANLE